LRGLAINTIPNTFIGGVASAINTPELLAQKFRTYPSGTFPSNEIYNFTIIGNDVTCFVSLDFIVVGFTNNANIIYFIAPINAKQINSNSFASLSATNYEVLYFPGVVKIPKSPDGFLNTQKLKRLYLPECVQYGSNTSANESVFSPSIVGATIYAHTSMQTINAGGEEGDLAYARSAGATIKYVQNYTPPSRVLNLSHSNGILTFTAPSSNNTLDFYEVWINGTYKQEITGSGATVSGLVSGNKVVIYACDIYYNRSIKSNEITI